MSYETLYSDEGEQEEIDYKEEWGDKYKSKTYLHQSKCVYVSLVIICDGYMRTEGEELDQNNPTDLIGCLKFGYTESPSSSVYDRMFSQFNTYGAVWTVPVLVIPCDNPSELESIVKIALKSYQVRIGCNATCYYKIPTEFFAVSQGVIDIIMNNARQHGCKKIYCTKYDLDEDSTLDKMVPEEFFPLFAEVSDSLSQMDIRTIRQTWA